MSKMLLSFFMILAVFSSSVKAASQNGLSEIFDDLHYSLTVEWDQQDQGFYSAQMETFELKLKQLKHEGLSQKDFQAFLTTKITDQRVLSDFTLALDFINMNKMTSIEAQSYMMEMMKKSYTSGAAWDAGEAAPLIIFVILPLTILAYLVIQES